VVPAFGLTAHIHAGDLPGLYRRDRNRPAEPGGYLKADPAAVDRWRLRLAALGGEGPVVGLCWRSMMRGSVRSAYYATLAEMLPLLRLRGFRFVCLQYDGCAEELDVLRRDHGIDLWRPADLDQREDLDGVAALISAMDLVISTATSVCVLAAAVGCPTIRLAPAFYSILDDRDLFFESLTPTLRRDEPMDISVAMARAVGLLQDRRPGPR
jgi:ADP-heptose:LPS heptosyltransferase